MRLTLHVDRAEQPPYSPSAPTNHQKKLGYTARATAPAIIGA